MRVSGQLCWYGQRVLRSLMLGKAFDNEDHIMKSEKTSSMFHFYLMPDMAAMSLCSELVFYWDIMHSLYFASTKMCIDREEPMYDTTWGVTNFFFQLVCYQPPVRIPGNWGLSWEPTTTSLVLGVAKVALRRKCTNSLSAWVIVVNSLLPWFVSQIFWTENNLITCMNCLASSNMDGQIIFQSEVAFWILTTIFLSLVHVDVIMIRKLTLYTMSDVWKLHAMCLLLRYCLHSKV